MGKAIALAGTLLLLTACSSGGSSSSASDAAKKARRYVAPTTRATSSSTTSTTRPPAKSDAVAIARRLGCADPKLDDGSDIEIPVPGIPAALSEVDCVAATTEFDIAIYASHAAVEKIDSPEGRRLYCSIGESFGQPGPYFEVLGADFIASASDPTPAGGGDRPIGTLAQAQALGRALGLPVTTIPC